MRILCNCHVANSCQFGWAETVGDVQENVEFCAGGDAWIRPFQRGASLARTLGAPVVSVRPSAKEGSIVSVVIAWELSWYGYEIDLADERAGARLIDQGTELDQLDELDRTPNAVADSSGMLHTAVEAQ